MAKVVERGAAEADGGKEGEREEDLLLGPLPGQPEWVTGKQWTGFGSGILTLFLKQTQK